MKMLKKTLAIMVLLGVSTAPQANDISRYGVSQFNDRDLFTMTPRLINPDLNPECPIWPPNFDPRVASLTIKVPQLDEPKCRWPFWPDTSGPMLKVPPPGLLPEQPVWPPIWGPGVVDPLMPEIILLR